MQYCMAMNWEDLRIFLALARVDSLSAAAEQLDVNQSTVSRRLAALEAQLGTQLVERGRSGHSLTAAGEDLLAEAGDLEETIAALDRRIAGRDQRLSGCLRVTCVDMMVEHYLAPHLAAFCAQHPAIELSLLTALQPLDLARQEADVAIRVSAAPPEVLVGRRLFGFGLAAYGSPDFVAALPPNPAPEEIPWIGWESESYNRRMVTAAYPEARVTHRVDSLLVAKALVQAGLGTSVFPCYWADREPGLRRLYDKPIEDDSLGLWVLSHPDLRRAARLRAFTAFISGVFLADRDLFEGCCPMN